MTNVTELAESLSTTATSVFWVVFPAMAALTIAGIVWAKGRKGAKA